MTFQEYASVQAAEDTQYDYKDWKNAEQYLIYSEPSILYNHFIKLMWYGYMI